MSHQSEQEELESVVALLEVEAQRAYEARVRALEHFNRVDMGLADARRELRHHIAAGDQS